MTAQQASIIDLELVPQQPSSQLSRQNMNGKDQLSSAAKQSVHRHNSVENLGSAKTAIGRNNINISADHQLATQAKASDLAG